MWPPPSHFSSSMENWLKTQKGWWYWLGRCLIHTASLQNRAFNICANNPLCFLLLEWICIGVKVHQSFPQHWVFHMESVVWRKYCWTPQRSILSHWSLLHCWWHFAGVAPGSGHLILWRLRPSYRTTLRSHTRFASPMKQSRWELTSFLSQHIFLQEHISRYSVFSLIPYLCVTKVLLSHRHFMWEQTPKTGLCVRTSLPSCSWALGKVSASLSRLQTR